MLFAEKLHFGSTNFTLTSVSILVLKDLPWGVLCKYPVPISGFYIYTLVYGYAQVA